MPIFFCRQKPPAASANLFLQNAKTGLDSCWHVANNMDIEANNTHRETVMTFNEFCDDILDLHVGMMTESQIADARLLYSNHGKTSKPGAPKHRDANLSAGAVRSKLERLLASQKIDMQKHSNVDLTIANAFVAKAEAALARRTKKADLLELITMNSDVSRSIKNQL